MKIAVIGAGAVGSVFGSLLSQAGEDVTLIGRKAHVEAVNRDGLSLESKSTRITIRVRGSEKIDFKPDLTLLAVKSQDVESSVREAMPYISGTPLVTMQNGVRSDDIVAGLLGKENVISSVISIGASFLEPGKVSYSILFGDTGLLIGDPFNSRDSSVQSVFKLFNKAFVTEISEDIRGAHWTKLLWNLNTAVPAVTGLTYKEGARYTKITKLYVDLMSEGLKVAKKAGIEPGYVPGFPIERMKRMVGTPQAISLFLAKRFFDKLPIYGSIYQSIKKGQKTEIDYMSGEIVRSGKELGIPTPANSTIVDLVHRVESSGKFLSVDEVTKALM